jgi:fructose-1,6-bisphosphatase/inositol monophosphatase family enzyme
VIHLDIDRVAALVREVAKEEILSRYRALRASDVIAKPSEADPDDIVTAADRAAERALGEKLHQAYPGLFIVGEEAAAKDPALVDRGYAAEQVLYVDPVDGTKNFAEGLDGFGVMLALVERQDPVAMWIYLPVGDVMFTAESGSGAYRDGERLASPSREHDDGWTGTLNVRHLPECYRDRVPGWYERLATHIPSVGCAAIEYRDLALGAKDFTSFFRLLPWDHAPGALLIREVGGDMRYLDGSPYRVDGRNDIVLAVSRKDDFPTLAREVFASSI